MPQPLYNIVLYWIALNHVAVNCICFQSVDRYFPYVDGNMRSVILSEVHFQSSTLERRNLASKLNIKWGG